MNFVEHTKDIPKPFLGREVEIEKQFEAEGTWNAMYSALRWVNENGYEEGCTCAMMPMAIMKGKYNLPWKWKNMTAKERNSVHGVVTGDMRDGPVLVRIFKS
jgi:hypothetical protein